MGHRYFAKVTFPAAAHTIPAIAAWLKDPTDAGSYPNIGPLEAAHECGCITVSASDRPDGEIGITDLLDDEHVPYDHYHSDDCSANPDPRTDHVRFTPAGVRVVASVGESAQAEGLLARELLRLLDSGDTTALRARLEQLGAQALDDNEDIEHIAQSWEPAAASATPRARQAGEAA